jgi:hypothetical protein
LSRKELWRNRRMGKKTMRITVIGAVIVVATVLIVFFVFQALSQTIVKDQQNEVS